MESTPKWLVVNRRLLTMKVFFFLYFAALAPILPYVMVYGRQLGIPEVIMGFINGILPIVYLIAKPLFGYLADRFSRYRKHIFVSILLLQSLSYIALYFVPSVNQHKMNNPELCINENNQYEFISCGIMPHCSVQGLQGSKCFLTCLNDEVCSSFDTQRCRNVTNIPAYYPLNMDQNISIIQVELASKQSECLTFNLLKDIKLYNLCSLQSNCTLKCPYVISDCYEIKDTEVTQTLTMASFWGFFLFMALATVGFNVTQTIVDAICMDLLGTGNENNYGIQRVWGTVGWGLIGTLSGVFVDRWSADFLDMDYTPAFILAIVFSLACLGSTYFLKLPDIPQSTNILKDVGKLLKDFRVVSFIIFVVLGGMIESMYIFFHFWYLEDLAQEYPTNNIKLLQGIVMAVQCFVSEVPFFLLSGKILDKLGAPMTLTLVYFMYSIRYMLYSLLTNPWWTLPIELLQGPTYCLLYATVACYAGAIAPPGTSATIQGIVGSSYDGLGYFCGSLLGGFLFRFYGGRETFQVFAILSICCSVAHSILYFTVLKKRDDPIVSYASPQDAVEMTELHEKSIEDCN